MLASDIVKRARSLADVPNSEFISHSDELESLWESYKDIYSKITDSSDDYYIKSVELDLSSAVQLGINEWEITLPVDMYKIRFVDFMDNGRWYNMDKFNTANRNKSFSRPQYRFRGNKFWVIGSSYMGLPSKIRVDYYPPPVKPTLPELEYSYCLSYPQFDRTKISSPNFFSTKNANLSDYTDFLIYVYDNTSIRVESTVLQTITTLYTSTGLGKVAYNLGYIYFLKGGDIWRASADLVSTIVPANLTSVGDITTFSISNGKLYFSNATDTIEANLDGTGQSTILAYPTSDFYVINGSNYYLRGGNIWKDGASLAIAAISLSGDGTNYYYLDSASVLHKNDEVFAVNIAYIGQPQNSFIAVINDQLDVEALSTINDTDFTYPINEALEILAYQCAIDFKRKQNGDITLLAARLGEIWDRYLDVLKRDEGQPEHRSSEFPAYNYY